MFTSGWPIGDVLSFVDISVPGFIQAARIIYKLKAIFQIVDYNNVAVNKI